MILINLHKRHVSSLISHISSGEGCLGACFYSWFKEICSRKQSLQTGEIGGTLQSPNQIKSGYCENDSNETELQKFTTHLFPNCCADCKQRYESKRPASKSYCYDDVRKVYFTKWKYPVKLPNETWKQKLKLLFIWFKMWKAHFWCRSAENTHTKMDCCNNWPFTAQWAVSHQIISHSELLCTLPGERRYLSLSVCCVKKQLEEKRGLSSMAESAISNR